MEKTDVLIIGGSAIDLSAEVAGKSNYPDNAFLWDTSPANSFICVISIDKSCGNCT